MEDYTKNLASYKKQDLKNTVEPTSGVYYYDPQSHLSTHERLFNDHITMSTFRGWIKDNSHLFKYKIVLDVGCGVGVFSMLLAKAGAARVIGRLLNGPI